MSDAKRLSVQGARWGDPSSRRQTRELRRRAGRELLRRRGLQLGNYSGAHMAIASAVGSIFFDLYPHVMVSTTNAAYNLTVANTASPSYTLKVMTVVALIFFPVVLLYQGWTFYVFRNRLHSPTDGASKTAPGGGETVVAVHTSEGEDG